MAGVHGRHTFAEPLPLVGSGIRNGWRKLAWGKQKLSGSVAMFICGHLRYDLPW
jgi:hypothetical protein